MKKLTIEHCRGQSYDNGSNIAGTYKEVQTRIRVVSRVDSLNIVGVLFTSSCPEPVTLFGIAHKVFVFFVSCTTRWKIMQKCTNPT